MSHKDYLKIYYKSNRDLIIERSRARYLLLLSAHNYILRDKILQTENEAK